MDGLRVDSPVYAELCLEQKREIDNLKSENRRLASLCDDAGIADVLRRRLVTVEGELKAAHNKNTELKAQIASSEPVEPHAINITRKAVKRLAVSLLEDDDREFFTVHGNDCFSEPKPAGKPVTLASSAAILKELWPEWKCPGGEPGTFFGLARSPKSEQLYVNSPRAQELAEARSAVRLAWDKERAADESMAIRDLTTHLYGPTKVAGNHLKPDNVEPNAKDKLNAANVDEPSGIAKGNTCPRCNEFNEYAEPGNRLCYGCAR